jgi:hypothetical protein
MHVSPKKCLITTQVDKKPKSQREKDEEKGYKILTRKNVIVEPPSSVP